jgi:hypothetical protein
LRAGKESGLRASEEWVRVRYLCWGRDWGGAET